MNLRQSVPDYLTSRKNTIIQIFFTAIFAFAFIVTYRPFGYDNWYGNIGDMKLMAGAAVVVLLGMVVIIITRIIMFFLKHTHEITLAVYIWMIAAEIMLLGVFYTALEKVILHDVRSALSLFFNAVQNTSLILLIPYTLSILFFAWKDIKRKLELVVQQFRDPSEIFIPIKDEKGVLRLTLKSVNILYLESNDNYVNVYYLDNEKTKSYLVRNSLKQLEKNLKEYPIYRCHRSYSVNIKNIKIIRKVKKGYELVINSPNEACLPVSRSYEKKLLNLLNLK
jgi:DNA-binding LytR/AlgR family response regulator